MPCRFEGPFTEEEKRQLRGSLRRLTALMQATGVALEEDWSVYPVCDARWQGLTARHRRLGAEFWAPTPARLCREIEKATAFLARPRED